MRKNFRLDLSQKEDARAALALLGESGLTLTDAARISMGITGGTEAATTATVEQGVDAFLRAVLAKVGNGEIRPRTQAYYEAELTGAFFAQFGEHRLDAVARSELRDYLTGLPIAQASRHARYRAIRAMYRHALALDPPLCTHDPTAGLKLAKGLADKTPEFLSVAEARACLSVAPQYRPALALMLFAGIRPEEIQSPGKPPLDFSSINRRAKLIRIPPEIAKTEKARPLEGLPANLWLWLKGCPKSGPVCPTSSNALRRAVKLAGGFIEARTRTHGDKVLQPWPHDATRKSFVTYHVAAYQDVARTSLLVGHEGRTSLIHTTYRALATQAEGKRYFAIVPG